MNNKSKKNFNDIPLTDLDYNGVIYEPSDTAKNLYNNTTNNINNTKSKPKIKKAPNFNFSIFFSFTIVIGVVIFILAFMLTFSSLSSYMGTPSNKTNSISNNEINTEQNQLVLDSNTDENILGIIKNINYDTSIFTFTDIKTNKDYTLKSKPSSIFKDKYDNMLTIAELKIGTIVDFSFDSSNKLNYIKENSDSFTLENVSNVKINLELNKLDINDKTLEISDKVITLKNNEPYEISSISPLDIIDIKGYNNMVYFINVKKGNGTLKLTNKPSLNNAIIEIDRNIFKSLNEIDSVNLAEGSHKVVIRSDDTLSFIREIEIIAGTETILDLNQLQNKSGTLIIKSNVTDYTLYVNNNIETSREPLNLAYGSYTIRAEKEGYTPFETQVNINSSQNSINIELEKIEKIGEMTISSNPDNAEVFVDNVLVGYTPLTYKLSQGVHTITLKKDGYNDFVLSSVTISDEENSFNITMHKSQNDTSATSTTTSATETTITSPTI